LANCGTVGSTSDVISVVVSLTSGTETRWVPTRRHVAFLTRSSVSCTKRMSSVDIVVLLSGLDADSPKTKQSTTIDSIALRKKTTVAMIARLCDLSIQSISQ